MAVKKAETPKASSKKAATTKKAAPKAATTEKKTPPAKAVAPKAPAKPAAKKAPAIKLSDAQARVLGAVHQTGEAGYAAGKGEAKTLEALLGKKMVKRGKKVDGAARFLVTKAGVKHLPTTTASSAPSAPPAPAPDATAAPAPPATA